MSNTLLRKCLIIEGHQRVFTMGETEIASKDHGSSVSLSVFPSLKYVICGRIRLLYNHLNGRIKILN